MVIPQKPQGKADPGSLPRVLRPALLCATVAGLLPLSASDISWKLCSLPAARCAMLVTLTLAVGLTKMVGQTWWSWVPSTVTDVYLLVRRLHGSLVWIGITVWVWVRAPRLHAFFSACRQYEQLFGAPDLQSAARAVRRFLLAVLAVVVVSVLAVVLTSPGMPDWLELIMMTWRINVYDGVIFWVVIFTGSCWSLGEAFCGVADSLKLALQGEDMPQLRRLVSQHGHLFKLAELLCHTFGGLIAFYLHMLLLDVSLSFYLNMRSFIVPAGSSLFMLVIQKLAMPLPLVLLKLLTDAGRSLSCQSMLAAGLLRSRLIGNGSVTPEPELLKLLELLQGQQVHMDMAGYFILDKSFFVQSMKDIITLLIAMAQFEMT